MNKRKRLSLEYGLVLLISVLVTWIFIYQQWRSHVLLVFNNTVFHYQRFWDLARPAAALLLVTSGCALYTTRRSFNLWIAQAQNPKAVVQYNWYVYLAQDRRKLQIAGAQDKPGQFFNYIANFESDYLPQYNKQRQIQPDYVNHVMRQAAHYQHHVLADGSLQLTWQAKKAHRQTLPVAHGSELASCFGLSH